MCNKDMR